MSNKRIAIVLLMVMCNPARAPANSDTGGDVAAPYSPPFVFSAFGTAGAVHSSEDRADFTGSIFKPNGAGYTHSWSTDVDTILGAQVVAHLTSKLSATFQLISLQRYDNTYTPKVEWANLKYQLTPDVSFRVGRIVLPSFLFSDSRNVGYSNPWVRLPGETYSLVPVSNNDGLDASYRLQLGDLTQTLVATYGRTADNQPQGGGSEARNQWVISDTLEYGAASVHAAYQEAHLTIDSLNTFIDTFRLFGSQGAAIANEFDQANKPLRFASLGAMYNPGEWFLAGEWGKTELHSVLGTSSSWYVSGGYRFGSLTPFVNYAVLTAESPKSNPGVNIALLPPDLVPIALGLNVGLDSILGSAPTQNTVSLGVRWDFTRDVDLKVQYDHTRVGAGSSGTLTNLQPGFRPGESFSLLSATIDFVW